MAMLGLAPAAAAVGGPEIVRKTTIVAPDVPVAMSGVSIFGDAGSAMNPVPVHAVKAAKARLKYLQWQKAAGVLVTARGNRYQSANIESRRATSPAIKVLLQEQYQEERRIAEAEENLKWEVAKSMAPKWVQKMIEGGWV